MRFFRRRMHVKNTILPAFFAGEFHYLNYSKSSLLFPPCLSSLTEIFLYFFPVDHVPPRLNIVGALILIL